MIQVQARKEHERLIKRQRQEDILLGRTAPKTNEKRDLSTMGPIKPSSLFTKYYPVRGPDNVRLAVSMEELDQWLIPKRLPKLKYQNVTNNCAQSEEVEQYSQSNTLKNHKQYSQSNTLHQTPWDQTLTRGAIPFPGRIWKSEKPVVHNLDKNSSKGSVSHDNSRNDHMTKGIDEFKHVNKTHSQDIDHRGVSSDQVIQGSQEQFVNEGVSLMSADQNTGVIGLSTGQSTPINGEFYYDISVTNVSDEDDDDEDNESNESGSESNITENEDITKVDETVQSEDGECGNENIDLKNDKDFLTVPSERFKLGTKSAKRAKTLQPASETGGLPVPEIRMTAPTPLPSDLHS